MKNNTFKKTERTLYNYRNLDLKIENIDLHIKRLMNDVSYAGVSFEQRSSPTNAFSSSVENEVIKREEHQTETINNLKRMKNDLSTLKQLVYNSIKSLKDEEYKMVDLRYLQKERKSWIEIGMTLCMDNTTCHRMKNRIINELTDSIFPNECIKDTFY